MKTKKKCKIFNKYKDLRLEDLQVHKANLEATIESCHNYIIHSGQSFLGPLSAHFRIKKCSQELEVINDMIAVYLNYSK